VPVERHADAIGAFEDAVYLFRRPGCFPVLRLHGRRDGEFDDSALMFVCLCAVERVPVNGHSYQNRYIANAFHLCGNAGCCGVVRLCGGREFGFGARVHLYIYVVDQLSVERCSDALGCIAITFGLRGNARTRPVVFLHPDSFFVGFGNHCFVRDGFRFYLR